MRIILRLLLTSLLLTGLAPAPTAAQGAISPSLSVNPGLIRETVAPGETKKVEIFLANLGADPIPLASATFNIAKINDAGAPEFTNASVSRSAADWITLDRPEIILNGLTEEKVFATVNVPKDAAPGGYSTAVIFQAKLPSYYFDLDANARILPALSVSFLLSVSTDGTLPNSADVSIRNFQVPRVVVSGPVPVVTEVSNPTDFFVYTDGVITIDPSFGSIKTVNELNRSVVMPESTRKYVNAYSGQIWPGVYTATVRLGKGEGAIVASAKFVAVPWQFLLLVVLLGAGLTVLLGRRRLKRAWRIIAKGTDTPTGPSRPIIR